MAGLQKIADRDIRFKSDDAYKVLRFFFPSTQFTAAQMALPYRAFAQALAIEAINKSLQMGFVELLMRNVLYQAPTNWSSVDKIFVKLVKEGVQYWFKNRDNASRLTDVKIYESVRRVISLHFRSVFEAALAADDPSLLK